MGWGATGMCRSLGTGVRERAGRREKRIGNIPALSHIELLQKSL